MANYCWVYGVIHFTSPVHRDQLRAQRSVTSTGKLYLYLFTVLNVCEKITSFCRALKEMYTKENWFLFSSSRCRYLQRISSACYVHVYGIWCVCVCVCVCVLQCPCSTPMTGKPCYIHLVNHTAIAAPRHSVLALPAAQPTVPEL